MEKKGYRECIEELNRLCPGKMMMSKNEVCRVLGLSYQTVSRKYGELFDGRYVVKTELARALCK